MAVNAVSQGSLLATNYRIEEDSCVQKVLSCVPLIGTYFTLTNQASLADKISKTRDMGQLVKLIEVKNHYKIGAMVHQLLLIAIFVTLIAAGVIHGVAATTVIGVCIALVLGALGYNSYRFHQNRQIVDELRATGFRPGMIVH